MLFGTLIPGYCNECIHWCSKTPEEQHQTYLVSERLKYYLSWSWGWGRPTKLFPINSPFYHGFPPDINNGKILKCSWRNPNFSGNRIIKLLFEIKVKINCCQWQLPKPLGPSLAIDLYFIWNAFLYWGCKEECDHSLYLILNGISAEGEMQISSKKVIIINKIHELNFVNYYH